jgi:phospholipase C
MSRSKRRDFLRFMAGATGAGIGMTLLPPAIRRALAIPARRVTGTIQDVQHIVILMQENRSFDHYFGTLRGVRGFGDRFPIPVPDSAGIQGKTVWYQTNRKRSGTRVLAPFHLNTRKNFGYMRVSGTPHAFPNAQPAWGQGLMNEWPLHKSDHSMAHFARADLPFQFALSEAFTICDAYHCSLHAGTNPNRCFLWTGTNDPLGSGHGPVTGNDYDTLHHDGGGGYTWSAYCERLQQAGIRWQIYQDMDDNFTNNPLAGFRRFRASYRDEPGSSPLLKQRALTTRSLDLLAADVRANRLPEVSWIIADEAGSEHPAPSSPAQGADYTARVLDALTSNPEVWASTVFIVNFDENDGFFDHVPPPAPPSYVRWDADPSRSALAGASTVDTRGEYHEVLPSDADDEDRALLHTPYGLGPRVPMYVISPWSKGGWVNSEVFDHTSVIRFIEQRFGVHEPNISPWRRSVCGDLTSAFDFAASGDASLPHLPDTSELAGRVENLGRTSTPPTPDEAMLPVQETGLRPSCALPYELQVQARAHLRGERIELSFLNTGRAGAVFHVYDRKHLSRLPRRYTVGAGGALRDSWALHDSHGEYDLWVLGPAGFHRHFTGNVRAQLSGYLIEPEIELNYHADLGNLLVRMSNPGLAPCTFELRANAYMHKQRWLHELPARGFAEQLFTLQLTGHWYDFTASVHGVPGFSRRFAGRVETGRASVSDPAMGGQAHGEQLVVP